MNEKSKLRKAGILKAGFDLFSAQSFHATTMEQIANRAGIARTTLYDYFKSKEEILFYLFDEIVRENASVEINSDVSAQLESHTIELLNRVQDNFVLYRILFREMPSLSEPAVTHIKAWQAQSLSQIIKCIERGYNSRYFSNDFTLKEVIFAYQALVGQKISDLLINNERVDSKTEAKRIIRLLLNGVREKE